MNARRRLEEQTNKQTNELGNIRFYDERCEEYVRTYNYNNNDEQSEE